VSKRGERLWRGLAVLAAFFYLVAMFAPWRAGCYQHKNLLDAFAVTVMGACGGWTDVLGISSIALCYLILVFALLGRRRSALSLEPWRAVLALALVALTLFQIFISLPGADSPALIGRFAFRGFSGLGYGAWAALGSSLALLLAVSVLDAGGLGKLLDRLPAWARLDRLEEPEEAGRVAGEPTAASAERSNRRWARVLDLTLIVYVLSLFTNWWRYSNDDASGTVMHLPSLFSSGTAHVDGFAGVGEFCVLAALATLVVTSLARSGQEHRLGRVRNTLVTFLIGLTVVNAFVVWRQTYETSSSLRVTHFRPEWGALVALAAILGMLLATLGMNAGGWTKPVDRLRARERFNVLEEPPKENGGTS